MSTDAVSILSLKVNFRALPAEIEMTELVGTLLNILVRTDRELLLKEVRLLLSYEK